jgi:hypothetical protein
MLLALLLAALGTPLGAMNIDIGWCLLAAAWGQLPAVWGREKLGRLIVGGKLGSDTMQLLTSVPKNIVRCLEERQLLCVTHVTSGHLPPSPLGSRQCPFRLLCSPWHGFRAWHSGCALTSPWRAWGSVRWPHCYGET